MATKKKLLQAAAGAAGGAALNVEDVFSTYLYTGNNSTQTITNGIDLAGEGGLMWTKSRNNPYDHLLFDTERGVGKYLFSNSTSPEGDFGGTFGLYANTSGTGFVINGSGNAYNDGDTPTNYASWTFRKAPKFFDVVSWTGDGTSSQAISHNLGSVPGVIIVKKTNSTEYWATYHRSRGLFKVLKLDETDAEITDTTMWGGNNPTDTHFYVGADTQVGKLNDTYVAYLFAHNDGDGEFGPDADADIIKCGSYTGNGSSQDIDLGFEAQWVMIKPTSTTGNWTMMDVMRGMPTSGLEGVRLRANTSDAEGTVNSSYGMRALETGFTIDGLTANDYNKSGETYIYIAIRRGPMAVPESATDVFDINTAGNPSTDPSFTSGFVTDMSFNKFTTLGTATYIQSRLQGLKWLYANTADAETTASSRTWDYMDGWGNSQGTDTRNHSWMWKRAPNYFDVVAYSGTGVARTINHNLGAVPEMMWVKSRTNTRNWVVYHKDANANPESGFLRLDLTSAFTTGTTTWNNTQPTASVFSVGTRNESNNASETFIAYLFASLAGVSKVGSYTGNGSTQTIDCGFSSGARFILIKRTDSTGDWYVWDTERGIVAANDPHLSLNTTATQVTTDDSIDPVSSGFAVNQVSATNINVSSATYIFYAIA